MAKPERINLNIGGQKFTTTSLTLSRIPDSRLAKLDTNDPSFDAQFEEYYFDRNPNLVNYILDGYRIGAIHFPHSSCMTFVKQELEFWNIGNSYIAPCCSVIYR